VAGSRHHLLPARFLQDAVADLIADGTLAEAVNKLPAPGMDGVYYSGGQCGLYYGIDAVTKTTIAFTVDAAQSMTYFGQPLPIDAPPLGVATLEKVK
jgi:hypothetical protein